MKEEQEEEKGHITSEIFSKLPAKFEIILEIFSHLPLKTVFKFNSISKSISGLLTWVDFTAKHSRNCRAIASTSFAGFFYQTVTFSDDMDTEYDEILFVPIESEAGCLPDPSLKFLKQRGKEDEVKLIDSCNGLLLCSNTNSINFVTTYFVCNPLTREKVALPHPCRQSNRVFYALLADINSSGFLQYKVVSFQAKRQRPWYRSVVPVIRNWTMRGVGRKASRVASRNNDGF
ncbi:F-box protein [Camellia lanceoleosa]|uniref:F-box protein n=1 Tax=Camellia lanceoleosa TaxID=1840588 RepID=A0ACC0J3L1_9ERIC|nr:F-box protein [Camellia lanceoleosa]